MAGFGVIENIYIVCTFGFLFFATLPFVNNCLDYLVRTSIPDEVQGRAWGLISFISQIGYVVAFGISGVAADTLGAVTGRGVGRGAAMVIIFAGLSLVVVSTVLSRLKSIRAFKEQV